MSEEHILAEWMHPYLPKIPDPKKETARVVVRKGVVVERNEPKAQQGHTYTYRIKVVCKTCNSGWMGTTETATKSILIPLLTGSDATLTTQNQAQLAFWLAMKFLVIECDRPSDTALSQDIRSDLYLNHTIPQGMEIWISAHSITEYYGYFWHRSIKIRLEERPFATDELKSAQTIILCAGRFFGFIFFNTVPTIRFTPADNLRGKLLRIWPVSENDIFWPPSELNMADAEGLNNIVIEIMDGISNWS